MVINVSSFIQKVIGKKKCIMADFVSRVQKVQLVKRSLTLPFVKRPQCDNKTPITKPFGLQPKKIYVRI